LQLAPGWPFWHRFEVHTPLRQSPAPLQGPSTPATEQVPSLHKPVVQSVSVKQPLPALALAHWLVVHVSVTQSSAVLHVAPAAPA
jgi:hypothetical protein